MDEQEYDRYKAALCKRILFFGERFCRAADTLYFGGGTPSLLGGERIAEIIRCAKSSFSLTEDAEITLEANPADDLFETLEVCAKAGVNRLSLGVQSAIPQELEILGRRHTNSDVLRTVEAARQAGITNISADLMLGIPKQTPESLAKSLEFLLFLDLSHISVYLLKVEPNTPFAKAKNLQFADDDTASNLYLQAAKTLKNAGFEHYEISNFAKGGNYSKHNLKYWNLEEYLGLGPAAHSFMEGKRFYFDRNTQGFIEGDEPIFDGNGGDWQEYIMLSLRTMFGLNEDRLFNHFGIKETEKYNSFKQKIISPGLAEPTDKGIRLSDSGYLMQNAIVLKILESLNL